MIPLLRCRPLPHLPLALPLLDWALIPPMWWLLPLSVMASVMPIQQHQHFLPRLPLTLLRYLQPLLLRQVQVRMWVRLICSLALQQSAIVDLWAISGRCRVIQEVAGLTLPVLHRANTPHQHWSLAIMLSSIDWQLPIVRMAPQLLHTLMPPLSPLLAPLLPLRPHQLVLQRVALPHRLTSHSLVLLTPLPTLHGSI